MNFCVVSRDLSAHLSRLEILEKEEMYFEERYEHYLADGLPAWNAKWEAEKDLRLVCRNCYGWGCTTCDPEYCM